MSLSARLLVVVAVAALAAGCGGSDDDPDASPTTPGPAETSTPTPTPSGPSTPEPAPTASALPGGAATIASNGDLAQLDSTSPAFRAFIDSVLGGLSTGECEQAPTVTVTSYDARGFAVGGVNVCGGYRAYWADVDGWTEVAGTQSDPPCEALEAVGFPRGLVGDTCFDGSGESRAYGGPA